MKQEDELVLKVTKEIVVKFIETGRLSVNTFDEAFYRIHRTVKQALEGENPLTGIDDEDWDLEALLKKA